MDSLENHGLIIRELRKRSRLTVQQAAKQLGKSAGWLCEVENGSGRCRLTTSDFERIVSAFDGAKHRPMFRIWVANHKNNERQDRTFDGAVLKFIRKKKRLALCEAGRLVGVSCSYLSKLERGLKPMTLARRIQMLKAYGYQPSSFKNLATDPVRSKAVPSRYKFEILMQRISHEHIPDSVKADRDLLKNSIVQIKSIVSALDEPATKVAASTAVSIDIYDTLINAAREIRLTIPPNIRFDTDIADSLVSAQTPHVPHDLRATLGNVVNNSIDAIGKANGSGIGLYHAKIDLKNIGGSIRALSLQNSPTQILISLPIESRAKWYLPRLKIRKDEMVFILDDQATAIDAWYTRLEDAGALNHARLFTNFDQLSEVLRKDNICFEQSHFLFDFDLSADENGLDYLAKLPSKSRKYLVTGHFDREDVRQRCTQDGVYLLPKSEIASLPIVIV